MGEYDALILKAKELIARKGSACKLERYVDDNTSSPGDPQSVVNAVDSPLSYDVSFVKFPAKGGEVGDEAGLLSPLDLTAAGDVLVGDIIVVKPGAAGEARWRVEEALPLAPDGDAIIWKVRVRLWPATTK